MDNKNKIVQGLWIGENLSNLEALSIKSFLDNGHEYHLYTYDEIGNIPSGVTIKNANDIIGNDELFYGEGVRGKKGYLGTFSDYFRWALLLKLGGWWVDTDMICLKPFDFDDEYVFSSEYTVDRKELATTAVIKVPAGCDMIRYCYDKAASIQNREEIKFLDIGPNLIREGIEKFNMQNKIRSSTQFMPISWWDVPKILNPKFNFEEKEENFAIHFWNEIWRSEKLDKNANYDQETLFEKLKQKYNVCKISSY